MSYTLITEASRDPALLDRVAAAVSREALDNPTFGETPFGRQALTGLYPLPPPFAYPVAIDTAAAYESAVIDGNENPGGDPAVITDEAILAAVQAHWPMT